VKKKRKKKCENGRGRAYDMNFVCNVNLKAKRKK